MTCIEQSVFDRAMPAFNIGGMIRSAARNFDRLVMERPRKWHRRHTTIGYLMSLNEHDLRDIGLKPSDIIGLIETVDQTMKGNDHVEF